MRNFTNTFIYVIHLSLECLFPGHVMFIYYVNNVKVYLQENVIILINYKYIYIYFSLYLILQ